MFALPCRPEDVYVATWPKAGTHWVHKLCTLILEHDMFGFPMEFNAWHEGPKWAGKGKGKGEGDKIKYTIGPPWLSLSHEDIPDPRIFAAHVPFEFLPEGSVGSRVVYVTRDIKDACISFYEFSLKNPMMEPETIDSAVDRWVAGGSFDKVKNTEAGAVYGGYMYHVKGYVDAAKAGRKIHFMNYDRLQLDTDGEICKLARFLGVTLTPERIAEVKEQASFNSMKAAAAASEAAKGKGKGAIGRMILGEPLPWSNILYNKGVRGEGKMRLTPEQSLRIDAAHADALKEVGHLFVLGDGA